MNIDSKVEHIEASSQKVYGMLCDCRNFEEMATQQQIQNWHAEEDFCEFEVPGIAKITLRIQEKQPYSRITYTVGNDKGIPASCTFDITGDETGCDLALTMDLDLFVGQYTSGCPILQGYKTRTTLNEYYLLGSENVCEIQFVV